MKLSRNTLKPLVVVAALTIALAGCSSDDGDNGGNGGNDNGAGADLDLVEAGALSVCANIPYFPFEIEDPEAPSGYSGFDMDLSQAIADNLGLELKVHNVDFNALQSGTVLVANQCDFGASAITITEERQANLDFADAYYDSLQSLLVAKDSEIAGLEDTADKQVGVQQGSTGKLYAEANLPDGATMVEFPGDAELWAALRAGQIDAILQDLPVNVPHAADDADYELVAEYETDEQYGFAFGKDMRADVREAVNAELKNLRDSGKYQEIYDSYFSVD